MIAAPTASGYGAGLSGRAPVTEATRGKRQKPMKAASTPPTPRGRRTRQALVDGARKVFQEQGYLGARVTDIAEVANVAIGTFYNYFDSREDIFHAVVEDIGDEFDFPDHEWDPAEPPSNSHAVERIEASNRYFLQTYKRTAALVASIEQAATVEADARQMRRQLRNRTVSRAERSLRRLQEAGLADPKLDAHCAASALASMTSNFAFSWLVLGEPFDEEVAAATLTRLWARAVGLDPDDVGEAQRTDRPRDREGGRRKSS